MSDTRPRFRRALDRHLDLIDATLPNPIDLLQAGLRTEHDLLHATRLLADTRNTPNALRNMATTVPATALFAPGRDPRPWLDPLLELAPILDSALPDLVERLFDHHDLEGAERVARAIDWPRHLSRALDLLLPALPPARRDALVDHAWPRIAAWHLPEPYGIEELAALVPLCPHRLESLLDRVERLPDALLTACPDHESPITSVARALAACGRAEDAVELVARRLAHAPREWRWAMQALAEHAPQPLRSELGHRILDSALATRDLALLAATPDTPELDPELAIATREFCRHAPAELALQAADALGARLESRAGEAAPDALEEWLDTLTHLDATSRLAPARLAALLAFARHRLEHEDDDRLLCSLVPHLSFDTAHALAAMSGDAWREVHLCLAERFPHLPVATMPSPDPMLVLLQHRRDRRAMLLERLAQAMAWAVPRRFVETSRALLEHAGVPPSTLERILATTLDDDYALPDGAPARLSRSQREAAWRTALDELVPDEWPTAWWWVALAWDEGGCELVRGLFEVLAELRQE